METGKWYITKMRSIALIAHNLRSTHNVGSLLRTSDCLGVQLVVFTGYTPYPLTEHDTRLPHEAMKINRQITKTALGAEKTQQWQHSEKIETVLQELKAGGYTIAALEQASNSETLTDFKPPEKLAIIIGREVEGIEPEVLRQANVILEIPMLGHKESLNVTQAAAIALYHCRYK